MVSSSLRVSIDFAAPTFRFVVFLKEVALAILILGQVIVEELVLSVGVFIENCLVSPF